MTTSDTTSTPTSRAPARLVLKYDSTPLRDPEQIADVIDGWRRNDWRD